MFFCGSARLSEYANLCAIDSAKFSCVTGSGGAQLANSCIALSGSFCGFFSLGGLGRVGRF